MLCPKVIDCHKGFCFYALFMSLWHFVPGLKKTGMHKSHCWKLSAGSNLWHECCLRLNPEKQVWQISAQQVVYNIWTTCLQLREKCIVAKSADSILTSDKIALLASRLLFGLIVREICDPSSWNAEPTRWSRCNLLAALINSGTSGYCSRTVFFVGVGQPLLMSSYSSVSCLFNVQQ